MVPGGHKKEWKSGTGWALAISAAALGALGVGWHQAVHSPLYSVRVVEVAFPSAQSGQALPLTVDQVREIAAVPVGGASLFSLNLRDIQARLLQEPWIRAVTVGKRFPSTLEIGVTFREAVGLWISPERTLRYVDGDGTVFGSLQMGKASDLPVFSSFPERELPRAAAFASGWQSAGLGRYAELAEVAWFADRGLRAVLLGKSSDSTPQHRWVLEMGQSFDEGLNARLEHLRQVLQYAAQRPLEVAGVRVTDDKKIVVKTGRGS
ncbi:MAG TPA: FtsQ-type POTRA domain-containing protein [Bdellovibrionota bacterium]|jgi:hypothetical protein|nr:FtsQ-type POTRA domain-containing protein [Bdellovibrionota bacterium]